MRELIILGTGIHSAEIAEIIGRINRLKPTWKLLGHIYPKSEQIPETFFNRRVLGGPDVIKKHKKAFFIADNEFPKNIPVPQGRWATIIDPTCFVHSTARIGEGGVLFPFCYVGARAKIGFRFFALSGTIINHDDVIGDYVVSASSVTLAGNVVVGDYSYLGQGCAVRQFIKLGRNCLIGMSAVVVKDVEENAVMAGNPARKMRDRAKVLQ